MSGDLRTLGGVGANPPRASFLGVRSLSLVLADFGTLLFRFILLISFRCLAFRDFSFLRTHCRPFTEVVRKTQLKVTRKVRTEVRKVLHAGESLRLAVIQCLPRRCSRCRKADVVFT